MKKLVVKTESLSYPVIVGRGIFGSVNEYLSGNKFYKNIFIIADGNVFDLYKKQVGQSFKYSSRLFIYRLKPGEASKNYVTINKIYSALLENNFGRDTLIVAIGGGVTGDIAGFVASTFMRGLQLVHVPTTLLACVDSAVGGKTGINFNDKKNIIGTFYQPELVLVDTYFLKTLPQNEITSGLGEIIKYAFLIDKKYAANVTKILPEIYEPDSSKLVNLIFESINFKASVVSADEKETGTRKILNLGHTFAHAFESELNFKIKHGEAVIAGIISALYLSNLKGLLEKEKLVDFLKIFGNIKLPGILGKADKANIYKIMGHDKKNSAGKIKFVLLIDTGKILTEVEAGRKEVLRAIENMQKFIS